jgi:hypothetical protein
MTSPYYRYGTVLTKGHIGSAGEDSESQEGEEVLDGAEPPLQGYSLWRTKKYFKAL